MNSLYEIEAILRDDWLVQVSSLHWSIAKSYADGDLDCSILPNVFMKELCVRIAESSDDEKKMIVEEIIYLAHWHSAIMLREIYSKIIAKRNG